METGKILIVDDDQNICELLRLYDIETLAIRQLYSLFSVNHPLSLRLFHNLAEFCHDPALLLGRELYLIPDVVFLVLLVGKAFEGLALGNGAKLLAAGSCRVAYIHGTLGDCDLFALYVVRFGAVGLRGSVILRDFAEFRHDPALLLGRVLYLIPDVVFLVLLDGENFVSLALGGGTQLLATGSCRVAHIHGTLGDDDLFALCVVRLGAVGLRGSVILHIQGYTSNSKSEQSNYNTTFVKLKALF